MKRYITFVSNNSKLGKRMKKYIYVGIVLLIVILSISLVIAINSKRDIEAKWKNAVENVKSYSDQYNDSEVKNAAFKLTIDELKSSKDSIFEELNAARKELKIKDSKLQSLQYVSSSFSRVDTIHIAGDTIFKGKDLSLDTLIYDDWYSLGVRLKYPSDIIVKPEFKSEKHIIVSTRRETVDPPKKFFLFRWFQRKQTVLNIDVVEKNPYVQKQSSRYVEIVR